MTGSFVSARIDGAVGRLTLDRPRALNALDLGMIRDLSAALDEWEDDEGVSAVLLEGAGDRGFCAGGDVRGLWEQIVAGRAPEVSAFFRAEYALNARIAEYPIPVVALADGITMGGGIGLAGHAGIRIVTERSRLAMPETRIGLTPDVGGSWLLARAPGRTGEYLGLTGASMDAADAVYAGFADLVVASDRLDELVDWLATEGGELNPSVLRSAIADFATAPAPSGLEAARDWIDDAFAAETVADIVACLRERPEPAASTAADTLDEVSPTSVAVTLAAVRAARGLPGLRAALEQEYGLVMWFAMTQSDLVEGIRAQLVDKDRSPAWRPATLAALPPGLADAALAYTPEKPLWG